MYIEITWCEIDRGFLMRLKECAIILLEWDKLYTTKADLMLDAGRLIESYFKMKGELK